MSATCENGDCVWVVCADNGTEGLGEPMLAVRGEDDARAAFVAMNRATYGRLVLYRVPLWPDVVKQATRRVNV